MTTRPDKSNSGAASDQRPGLVLSGGGARGAYQAGALKAIAQIAGKMGKKHPFPIITGVSAGAVNAAYMGVYADHIKGAAHLLTALWGSIHTENIFRTDPISFSQIGLRWASGLVSGGVKKTRIHSLLDTQPLRQLLTKHLKLPRVQSNIDSGVLRALAITATDYATSLGITFVAGNSEITPWQRSRRSGILADLSVEHVMASAAIPLLFPAVQLEDRWYGDGCLRNMAPLSPAVRLGADRLLVVGVRRDSQLGEAPRPGSIGASAGRVLSVLINSVMLDGTENDLESLARTNALIDSLGVDGARRAQYSGRDLRRIDFLCVKPTEDLAQVALAHAKNLPPILRYLVKGLGPVEETAELISYLLFEPPYCRELIALGFEDAMRARGNIEALIGGP